MSRYSTDAHIDPRNLRDLERKLGPDTYRAALRKMLDDTSAEIEVAAHRRSPYGSTSVLSRSISHTVDSSPVPLWAKVSAEAEHDGFRYGWALQNSEKVQFHYLRGPFAGKRTRGWFTGALRGAKQRLNARLVDLAASVEARWRS